ncbi:MAG: TrmH family RNA methyltransferase [Polaribacter sp.]|jgi:TrmH family RNA methyltransferase
MLDQIKVILSHTTHPGNIGATARAMKVMGLSKLRLVNPKHFPSAEATERASKASDLLTNAEVFESTEQAISECRLVVGASVRTRSLSTRLVTPRELTTIIKENSENVPVALLFGTENSGLTNEELHLCHYQVYIPTNSDYSSLNLSQAVQLIAYEMRLAFSQVQQLPEQRVIDNERVINRNQLDGLLNHLKGVMTNVGYLNIAHQKQIDNRLNRLFSRTDMTESEFKILRGFLSSIENKLNLKQT